MRSAAATASVGDGRGRCLARGAVREEADANSSVAPSGKPVTQRTYAYLLVDYLRWLEREALRLRRCGRVRLLGGDESTIHRCTGHCPHHRSIKGSGIQVNPL